MANATSSCKIEGNIRQETLCCVLDGFYSHNGSLPFLLNATNRCFSESAVKTISLHLEELESVFSYVSRCMNSSLPHCSTSNDSGCSNETRIEYAMYIIFLVIVLFMTFVGNLLLIVIILNTRTLRKMRNSAFIVSLAVSDLLVGLFIIPVKLRNAYHNLYFCDSATLCRAYITIDNILFVASITNLFVLTIDRFIALQYSYTYIDIMSKKRVKGLTIGVWCYAICWGLASNVNWSPHANHSSIKITEDLQCISQNKFYILVVFCFVFYLPSIGMGYIYSRIFKISRQHIKAITATQVHVVQPPTKFLDEENLQSEGPSKMFPLKNEDSSVTPPSSPLHVVVYEKKEIKIKIHRVYARSTSNVIKEAEERSKILKVAKTVGIVYGCFMVCWLPITIFGTGLAWSHTTFSTVHAWPHVLIADILPVLNSAMNPVIYSLKSKIYVKALRKMTSRVRHRARAEIGL